MQRIKRILRNFKQKLFLKYLFFTSYKVSQKFQSHLFSYRSSLFQKKSSAFSMMELLFVLVILGILASLALPRISLSRNNALSVAIQSDIQTILSSTQEYAITNEIQMQNANPQWLITYLNLSPQRWIASGDSLKIAKNGVRDSENDCLSIRFDGTNSLQVLFNRSINSNLCQNLLKNYANDIIIPLHITF